MKCKSILWGLVWWTSTRKRWEEIKGWDFSIRNDFYIFSVINVICHLGELLLTLYWSIIDIDVYLF